MRHIDASAECCTDRRTNQDARDYQRDDVTRRIGMLRRIPVDIRKAIEALRDVEDTGEGVLLEEPPDAWSVVPFA